MARAFAVHDARGLDVSDEGYDELLEVEDLRNLPGAIQIAAEETAAASFAAVSEEAAPPLKSFTRAGSLMLNRQPGSRAKTPKPTRSLSASVDQARQVVCFILSQLFNPFPFSVVRPSPALER
jgi:hypothetical protein